MVALTISMKNPQRLFVRIELDLMPYNFIIPHTSGKINVIADALSRGPEKTQPIFVPKAECNRLNSAQRDDPTIAPIIDQAQTETMITMYRTVQVILVYVTTDRERNKYQIVKQESLKQAVLTSCHDEDGHGNAFQTGRKIQQRYTSCKARNVVLSAREMPNASEVQRIDRKTNRLAKHSHAKAGTSQDYCHGLRLANSHRRHQQVLHNGS